MKKTIFLMLILSSFFARAQNATQLDFQNNINYLTDFSKALQIENSKLKSDIRSLNSKLGISFENIEDLKKQIDDNSNKINSVREDLDQKIQAIENNNLRKIADVNDSLSKNSLYGIIGVLSAILLSGLLYWISTKRQKTDKTDIIEQLGLTKSSIEESLVKEFGKQTELLEAQLLLLKVRESTAQPSKDSEPDHSLPLKVASEINLIERNINLMDTKTRGLKQLQASVGKLKDNLAANGYEMPELLGKQFHQGMKVIVTSTNPDENLEKDSEVITKVLIPQVNYNEKMIQTAQIETSKGF
jgi:hypothetical protein